MADVPFIQRSRIGRTVFLLRDEVIEITTLRLGVSTTNRVPLRSIDLDYQLVAQRFWLLIIIPLVLCGAAIGVAAAILTLEGFPQEFSIYPVLFAVICAIGALRGVPRVELFVFSDHWRKPLFYIVRESSQKDACETFLTELIERIENVKCGIPAPPSTPAVTESAVSVSGPAEEHAENRREYRWILSLVSGALAAAAPFALGNMSADAALCIIGMAAALGLSSGVMSFVAKERGRFLAVPGMILSLVGPMFC